MHIGVVGVGRVGQASAFAILERGLADELSLVDIKPGLAEAVAEELKHAAAGFKVDAEIHHFERDEDLSGADVVLICAGTARPPGVRIPRSELVKENAAIIRDIAEAVAPRNPGAKFVVVTNPVDAMAALFKKISGADYVISTGNHLDTLRMKAKLAEEIRAPVSSVEGYVGGEHGRKMFVLWSTIRVGGRSLEELEVEGITVDREEVERYVREVPEGIIDMLEATRYGPAAAFRDIVESIVLNMDRVLSVAAPTRLEGLDWEAFVSVPRRVGMTLGPPMLEILTPEERQRLREAIVSIRETYAKALEVLGLSE